MKYAFEALVTGGLHMCVARHCHGSCRIVRFRFVQSLKAGVNYVRHMTLVSLEGGVALPLTEQGRSSLGQSV